MDYLKQISIQLGGKIRSQNLSNWNFSEKSFRTLTVKDYKGFKIVIDEFGNLFSIEIHIESDFTISINNPDKLNSIDNPIIVEQTLYKTYIYRESYQEFTKGHKYNPFLSDAFKIFWQRFIETVNNLNLNEDETVAIRPYCICLDLHSKRKLIDVVDDFIELTNTNIFRKETKERIYAKNIPENLRPLIPLLKIWHIPDDSEREQLLEETSEKQKSKLLNTVRPFMVEINAFLDSFKDEPLSHEAMLLGNLAELISEIWVENP